MIKAGEIAHVSGNLQSRQLYWEQEPNPSQMNSGLLSDESVSMAS
jgi:hypothetical protein